MAPASFHVGAALVVSTFVPWTHWWDNASEASQNQSRSGNSSLGCTVPDGLCSETVVDALVDMQECAAEEDSGPLWQGLSSFLRRSNQGRNWLANIKALDDPPEKFLLLGVVAVESSLLLVLFARCCCCRRRSTDSAAVADVGTTAHAEVRRSGLLATLFWSCWGLLRKSRSLGSSSPTLPEVADATSASEDTSELHAGSSNEERGGRNTSRPTLQDGVQGLLVGAALGDAMGVRTAGLAKDEALKICVASPAVGLPGAENSEVRKKYPRDWTEVTDQHILLLETLVESRGSLNPADGSSVYANFYSKYAGPLVELGRADLAALFVWSHPRCTEDVCGGADVGPVARCAILGAAGARSRRSLPEIAKDAVALCRLTHADPRCAAACAALCTLIAKLLEHLGALDKQDFAVPFSFQANHMIEESLQIGTETLVAEFEQLPARFAQLRKAVDSINDDTSFPRKMADDACVNWEKHEERLRRQCESLPDALLACATAKLSGVISRDMDIGTDLPPCYHALRCGILALRQICKQSRKMPQLTERFQDITHEIMQQGGDASANCSVACAVMGAAIGATRLPSSSVESFQLPFGDVLREHAKNLFDSAIEWQSAGDNFGSWKADAFSLPHGGGSGDTEHQSDSQGRDPEIFAPSAGDRGDIVNASGMNLFSAGDNDGRSRSGFQKRLLEPKSREVTSEASQCVRLSQSMREVPLQSADDERGGQHQQVGQEGGIRQSTSQLDQDAEIAHAWAIEEATFEDQLQQSEFAQKSQIGQLEECVQAREVQVRQLENQEGGQGGAVASEAGGAAAEQFDNVSKHTIVAAVLDPGHAAEAAETANTCPEEDGATSDDACRSAEVVLATRSEHHGGAAAAEPIRAAEALTTSHSEHQDVAATAATRGALEVLPVPRTERQGSALAEDSGRTVEGPHETHSKHQDVANAVAACAAEDLPDMRQEHQRGDAAVEVTQFSALASSSTDLPGQSRKGSVDDAGSIEYPGLVATVSAVTPSCNASDSDGYSGSECSHMSPCSSVLYVDSGVGNSLDFGTPPSTREQSFPAGGATSQSSERQQTEVPPSHVQSATEQASSSSTRQFRICTNDDLACFRIATDDWLDPYSDVSDDEVEPAEPSDEPYVDELDAIQSGVDEEAERQCEVIAAQQAAQDAEELRQVEEAQRQAEVQAAHEAAKAAEADEIKKNEKSAAKEAEKEDEAERETAGAAAEHSAKEAQEEGRLKIEAEGESESRAAAQFAEGAEEEEWLKKEAEQEAESGAAAQSAKEGEAEERMKKEEAFTKEAEEEDIARKEDAERETAARAAQAERQCEVIAAQQVAQEAEEELKQIEEALRQNEVQAANEAAKAAENEIGKNQKSAAKEAEEEDEAERETAGAAAEQSAKEAEEEERLNTEVEREAESRAAAQSAKGAEEEEWLKKEEEREAESGAAAQSAKEGEPEERMKKEAEDEERTRKEDAEPETAARAAQAPREIQEDTRKQQTEEAEPEPEINAAEQASDEAQEEMKHVQQAQRSTEAKAAQEDVKKAEEEDMGKQEEAVQEESAAEQYAKEAEEEDIMKKEDAEPEAEARAAYRVAKETEKAELSMKDKAVAQEAVEEGRMMKEVERAAGSRASEQSAKEAEVEEIMNTQEADEKQGEEEEDAEQEAPGSQMRKATSVGGFKIGPRVSFSITPSQQKEGDGLAEAPRS